MMKKILTKSLFPYLVVFILMGAISTEGVSQTLIVKGRITNSGDNQPLPSANVVVKGTKTGTTADADGYYSLQVPSSDAILVFSYVSFENQEIPVNNRTEINIALVEISALQEVVVIGYGEIKKSDYAGSTSTYKFKPDNENRVISVPEALQGRLSGVQILNNSGEPGAGMTFNIRGTTSITGSNRPLIVVDGQPIESSLGASSAGTTTPSSTIMPSDPLATLNPNDVKSIEILKDASSTAIYGSRGANGVVLITTKSGASGKDKIMFSSRVDRSSMPKFIPVLSSRDYLNFLNEANVNDGLIAPYSPSQVDSLSRLFNTNWQDLVYRDAISQEHQLSLSGGNEKSRYLLSFNYLDQNSVIKNADYKRLSARLNFSRQITNKLKLTLNTSYAPAVRNYALQSNSSANNGTSLVNSAIGFSPIEEAYDDLSGELDLTITNNPLTLVEKFKDRTDINNLTSNLNIEYELSKNLTYKLVGGFNRLSTLRQNYWPRGTTLGNQLSGTALRADNTNANYLIDHILTYVKSFNKHSINAVLGYSFQSWHNQSSSVTNSGFPSDEQLYRNMASAASPGLTTTLDRSRALSSGLGRLNYAYDSRYILTLTGRYDGASRLSKSNRWQFFPSIGAGWNIHNEAFFGRGKGMVSQLKLRGSMGIAGNENIDIGATQALYTNNYNAVGTTIATGYNLDRFANPNLTWEKTTQYNAGIDFGILQDRYVLTVDAYQKTTTDLLINLQLPSSSTFDSYFTNIGKVSNRGIDVEAKGKILTGKVKWDANANISFMENKVVNLGGDVAAIYGQNVLIAGGMLSQPVTVALPNYAISSFLGYKTNGIYQNAKEVADGKEPNAKPGDFRFVDIDGDGKINENDRTVLGKPNPDFMYGFGSDISFKGWAMAFTILGSQGNSLINLNQWFAGSLSSVGALNNQTQEAYDNRWRGEGTSNKYPRPNTSNVRFNTRFPDYMVEDASFIRLQNLNLSYTFNKVGNVKSKSIKVYVSGTNLFTITKYTGYDPNINAFGSRALQNGVDFGTLPQTRTYSGGIVANF